MSAGVSVSKEDLRSSRVEFGSFLEDMELVLTYVPGDETGVMNGAHGTGYGMSEGSRKMSLAHQMPGARSTPVYTPPYATPELASITALLTQSTTDSMSTNLGGDASYAATASWPTPQPNSTITSRPAALSTGQAFLGTAAIVSSSRRNTPVSSSMADFDMDQIQNALNAAWEPIDMTPPVQTATPETMTDVPLTQGYQATASYIAPQMSPGITVQPQPNRATNQPLAPYNAPPAGTASHYSPANTQSNQLTPQSSTSSASSTPQSWSPPNSNPGTPQSTLQQQPTSQQTSAQQQTQSQPQQTQNGSGQPPQTATRTTRAAGRSDAPKFMGIPRPAQQLSPASSSPALATSNAQASTPPPQQPTSPRPNSQRLSALSTPVQPTQSFNDPPPANSNSQGSSSAQDGQEAGGGRQRIRLQSALPLPSHRALASFEELLLEPTHTLLKALCTCLQVTEATKTCASVVMIFESKQRTLQMIREMIEHEVALQKTAGTLFRNNSLTTHMMTCYTKIVGLPYLKTVIGPVILEAFAQIEAGKVTYEIDPSKLAPGEDLKRNVTDLKALVNTFFDRILNSRAVMPKNFMEICHTLQASTIDRFPESKFFVIGGFLFLRYICPAVVAPDGYKLITGTISDKQRRMLVLVSKILQTIANERTFGDKEEFMMSMNGLVNEYQGIVQYFFNNLAKPVMPNTPENSPGVLVTTDDYQLALKQVYAQVKAAKTKLQVNELIQKESRVSAAIDAIDNLPLS